MLAGVCFGPSKKNVYRYLIARISEVNRIIHNLIHNQVKANLLRDCRPSRLESSRYRKRIRTGRSTGRIGSCCSSAGWQDRKGGENAQQDNQSPQTSPRFPATPARQYYQRCEASDPGESNQSGHPVLVRSSKGWLQKGAHGGDGNLGGNRGRSGRHHTGRYGAGRLCWLSAATERHRRGEFIDCSEIHGENRRLSGNHGQAGAGGGEYALRRSGDGNGLGAARRVVGDAERRCGAPASSWCKRDLDGATVIGRERRRTIVGLPEFICVRPSKSN